MSKSNHVFQVLVVNGNQGLLAEGNEPSDLAVGQLGIFNAETNISIDGTTVAVPQEFYMAVGADTNGDGVMDKVLKSAGQKISVLGLRGVTWQAYTAPQPMIVDISGYRAAFCDTEYTIRLEFRNQKIYRNQGYNQFSQAYTYRTPVGGPGCNADGNQITAGIVRAINAQDLQLATATAIADDVLDDGVIVALSQSYAVGDVVSLEDVDVLAAYNLDPATDPLDYVYTSIRIETNEVEMQRFFQVNTKYYGPRQTVVIPSLVEGFLGNGTINVVQNVRFEQGLGYDIKQKEYEALGWKETGAYRTLGATGLAKDNFEYYAVENTPYSQLVITNEEKSYGGFQTFNNTTTTIIAIPFTNEDDRDEIVDGVNNVSSLLGFAPVTFGNLIVDATGADAVVDKVATYTVDETDLAITAEEGIYSVAWSQTAGIAATITNGDTLEPTFGGLVDGETYVFTLTVTDKQGTVVTSTVTVTRTDT